MTTKEGEVWFAWYPVKTDDGSWVWLKNVIREEDFVAVRVNMEFGTSESEYIYTKIEESE